MAISPIIEQIDAKVPASVPAEDPPSKVPAVVNTPFSGHALVAEEGNAIAASEPSRVIVLVGPTRSGKTTLLLSIYEEFRRGSFGGAIFAGSRTLLGFEERCHLSREASQGEKADTERTKADAEEVLLHLRVRKNDVSTNLILCDLSGELFDAAGESTEALLRVPFLRGAAHVVMFVDGQKLQDRAERQVIRQTFMTLFRATVEVGRLNKQSLVDVVFSKQDQVISSNRREEIEAFQTDIEKTCISRFGDKVGALRFYRVISRPKPNSSLVDLFRSWIERRQVPYKPILPEKGTEVRQIDSFGISDQAKLAIG